MADYQISGTCNRCGQCCGAPGSPNQDSPWPDNWPEALAAWSQDALDEHQALFRFLDHPSTLSESSFAVKFGNIIYRGIWVPGHGLCKDEEPYGDITTYSETCPFLMEQETDGSYPCALVQTNVDYIYYEQCAPMGDVWSEASVQEWQANHPLCSYVFTEIED